MKHGHGYFQLSDRLPALLAPMAAIAIAGLGVLTRLLIVDPLINRADIAEPLAREGVSSLTLLFFLAALASFGAMLFVVYLLQRPTRDLAARIALAGMAADPMHIEIAGPEALRQVARRYNALVDAVQQTNQELRTHAKQQSQRAATEEVFSDQVLAGVPSGIIAVDAQGQIRRVNRAALNILERSADDMLERDIDAVLGLEHPLTRAAHQTQQRYETDVEHTDGSSKNLVVSSGAVRDDEGTCIGHTVIFADQTELKRLEQELALKRRLASLGELSAGLAHEVRNPLGALRGFVELLDRKLEDPERAHALLQKMTREIDALASVVGDFLAFARPAPPTRSAVQVSQLLEEALSVGIAACGRTDVRTRIVDTGTDVDILVDAAQIRRALVNFVINAIQAVAADGQVILGCRCDDPNVELFVQDDGPGVPAEVQDKLATPFVSTKRGGTGLGLAIAHQVAQAHGGHMRFESPAETGARFVLVLPQRELAQSNDAACGGPKTNQ